MPRECNAAQAAFAAALIVRVGIRTTDGGAGLVVVVGGGMVDDGGGTSSTGQG